ncbi:MAG: hypothetical protein NTV93_20355 [Verrucomicrobia bacterium]|nr:hypothetical protein [Verrucomicrobiota bacterium]
MRETRFQLSLHLRWCSNTIVPANKAIDIPGTHKSGFEIEIAPPFGSDVVEVIACSKPSELHKTLSQFAAKPDEKQPFQVLTRGMVAKGIDSSLAATKATDSAPLRCAGDRIRLSSARSRNHEKRISRKGRKARKGEPSRKTHV